MSRLSRNLLLLSKIENNQYHAMQQVNLCDKIVSLLPRLESLAEDLTIRTDFKDKSIVLDCNETLLESMLNNLVVNAVRHNKHDGVIIISVIDKTLVVANTSDEQPIDESHIFSRFYRSQDNQKGNGLGLAIVKSICDFHHWQIHYKYVDGYHQFVIDW